MNRIEVFLLLISKELNDRLNEIIGKCFEINRMLDRGMSLLKVRWKMINSSNILHENVAHAYPSSDFADGISDYQGLRGNETIYPATPIGNKEYDNVLDFFKDYHNENILLENMIKDAIDDAVEEGDNTTKIYLDKVLKRLSEFTALSQDMIDLFGACENDSFKLLMLDSNIEKYVKI